MESVIQLHNVLSQMHKSQWGQRSIFLVKSFEIHLVSHSVCFPVAAPAAPGGRQPAASHHVPLQWSDLELCTPGSLPSCVTTPPRCRPPSPAHRPPRSSPRILSSRTQPCPPTQLRTPSPSWRRLGGGWRRRGGGTHCSRPSRGWCREGFNMYLCWQVFLFECFDMDLALSKA